MRRLDYHWYARSPWLLLLTPLSLVFRMASALRRAAYRAGLLRSRHPPVPVIVIGNITAGGTGKTPLVVWLAAHLQSRGYRPGIIARGYGGRAKQWPQQVRSDSDPAAVGDEAVMLADRTGCPMAVGPDRLAAADALIEHNDCDVIISDDGLQHYALQRDIEIAVIDGVRRFGTGFMLPAGPLREPVWRLDEVDLVVVNGLGSGREHPMRMLISEAVRLKDGARRALAEFKPETVHAVAGIGHPERFFRALAGSVRSLEPHPFPDHHGFTPQDIDFGDDRAILMTEKDAVKCREFAGDNVWYVPVEVHMQDEFTAGLDALLQQRLPLETLSRPAP
ncbi:MAG: tetraacyldisaccharide 4'-kinase [Thiohalobacterales bacterium]|nr:tetraacyldisaccharide 4'-kinase [Thiohalobacterales bacterium]